MSLSVASRTLFQNLQSGATSVAATDLPAALREAGVAIISSDNKVCLRYGSHRASLPAQAMTFSGNAYPDLMAIATNVLRHG
jgi:hypothetical protein